MAVDGSETESESEEEDEDSTPQAIPEAPLKRVSESVSPLADEEIDEIEATKGQTTSDGNISSHRCTLLPFMQSLSMFTNKAGWDFSVRNCLPYLVGDSWTKTLSLFRLSWNILTRA